MHSIRQVGLRDLGTVGQMEKEIFGAHALPYSGLLWHATRWRRWFLVAQGNGSMLGYVIARPDPAEAGCVEVASVAVGEEARGAGLGTRLLTEVLEQARRRGAQRAVLEVSVKNPRAQALYRRLGFRHQRLITDYYGRGEDGIRMVLELAGSGEGDRR